MRNLLLPLVFLVGSVVSAAAACSTPATMHDFPGASFLMSLSTNGDGNCQSNVAVPSWAGGVLGAMANYGTSPGAVLVPGVNASVTGSVLPTGASTSALQTTINTTLGSPFQAGGSIGNTTFAVTQGTSSNLKGQFDPLTIATWGLAATSQNVAVPTNGQVVLGQFTTTPTTLTTGNVSPLQMDNAGNLLVNIKTGASSGAVAQGSTTSGQSGLLVQCAVTTSAPTYTTAQTDPLSCDTTGNMRVTVTNANANGQALAANSSPVVNPVLTVAGAAVVKGGVPVVNGASTYQHVAASQTGAVLQTSTGAIGDYLSHCVIYPSTTAAGSVTVFDNANAAATNVIEFTTGTLSNLAPITIPVGAVSTAGAWKVTTGANETVVCYGKFS